MVTSPIDASQFPYKKAAVSAGACTSAELTALYNNYVTSGGIAQVSQWTFGVSERCTACVFSEGGGAAWPPMITGVGQLKKVNLGGCIEVKSGKESCGRAYQQFHECQVAACSTHCKASDDYSDCRADHAAIVGGPCAKSFQTVTQACGANISAYENDCDGVIFFEGPVKAQCIDGH